MLYLTCAINCTKIDKTSNIANIVSNKTLKKLDIFRKIIDNL